jgi:quinol monooxygenase YgiN
MAQTVRFTVELTIKDGRLEEYERLVDAMIAGSEKEPGTVVYEFTLSEDRTKGRILEGFDGADAVRDHMQGSVVGELVPQLLELATIDVFTVDGDPGPLAREMLAGFGARFYDHWKRFTR